MIQFNVPTVLPESIDYIEECLNGRWLSGDGVFSKKASLWIEEHLDSPKILLTTSGTSALEMAMKLAELQPGDEVILPSYTFSSTATAAVNESAKLVFVDIRPDTMNIDETKIEDAITSKTKMIIVMHYGGIACEMDTIMDIAHRHGLIVVEDAAQGFMSKYKGKSLGTIGDFGCFSFHETKNFSMGEGGAISINDTQYSLKAEILREKGTNRSMFYRGQVDKYTWIDKGSSYLPSEILSAYLYSQLARAEEIQERRHEIWNRYKLELSKYEGTVIETQHIPEGILHNAHLFYIKLKDIEQRQQYIEYMKQRGIMCTFHYIPLHCAPAGNVYGRFNGDDVYTTKESERLVRLPLYYELKQEEEDRIVRNTRDYLDGLLG